MELINKLMDNFKKFREQNPDISEAINDGYEIACYDEETEMIIAVELENGTLKIRIVEDAHIIKKTV